MSIKFFLVFLTITTSKAGSEGVMGLQFGRKAKVLRLCGDSSAGFAEILRVGNELAVVFGLSYLIAQVDEVAYVLVVS
jgi:hypothetical protein